MSRAGHEAKNQREGPSSAGMLNGMDTRQGSIQRFRRLATLLLGVIAAAVLSRPVSAQSPLNLPPIPEDESFVHDRAGILAPATVDALSEMQREAFEEHDTPIIVVTILARQNYGARDRSIASFGRAWFDHWEIGKRGADGEVINRGMLLMVSLMDREARIELGAEWGRRWDDHAARIMEQAIVHHFRNNDYNRGVREGVGALLAMARLGPDADLPRRRLADVRDSLQESLLKTTPLPMWVVAILVAAGLVCLLLAFIVPEEYRNRMLMAGGCLVVGAFVLWVLLAALAAIMGTRDGGAGGGWFGGAGGSFSGGGFSGGGFGGGFSGGGGASGGW